MPLKMGKIRFTGAMKVPFVLCSLNRNAITELLPNCTYSLDKR